MSRALNGEALPADCPCPIAVVGTVQHIAGRSVTTSREELRPLLDCPHHGDQPGAVPEPVPPVDAETPQTP
jgi:hypothetical protein